MAHDGASHHLRAHSDWKQIHRKTILKLCEHLGREIGEIFFVEFEKVWGRLEETGHVDLILGGRTLEGSEFIPSEGIPRVGLGYWDMLAWAEFLKELRHIVPERFSFDITEYLNSRIELPGSKSVIKPAFVTFRKKTNTPYGDRYLTGAKLLIRDSEFEEKMKRACNLIEN